MRIIFSGIIGRYPWGGVTWCSLMYLLGLRKLGHDVYYLEDTGECNYDPEIDSIANDPKYALKYIHQSLAPYGFGDRWTYVDYRGQHSGISQSRLKEICQSADLFMVLSGGCWNWRDSYLNIPCKVFVDSDPAFTQLAIDKARLERDVNEKAGWYEDFFRSYDHLFTFGSNIGTRHCSVPTGHFKWKHTWQPVSVDLWQPEADNESARNLWTTIMTWQIESFKDIGGNKNREFLKILDLANRCRTAGGPELELAINGPKKLLRREGWNCTDAFAVSKDLNSYREYIAASRAEFSVAKKTYVQTNSGWFSDRTACYLASGKPAVVQATGFERTLPTGEGLMVWRDGDEAFEAIQQVEKNYPFHRKRARQLAAEHFDAPKVLKNLLEQCN